jgi:hypothetical protein
MHSAGTLRVHKQDKYRLINPNPFRQMDNLVMATYVRKATTVCTVMPRKFGVDFAGVKSSIVTNRPSEISSDISICYGVWVSETSDDPGSAGLTFKLLYEVTV